VRKSRKTNIKSPLDSPRSLSEEFSSYPYVSQDQESEAEAGVTKQDIDKTNPLRIQEIDGVERKLTQIYEVDGVHERRELEGTVFYEADTGNQVYELSAVSSRE
jgi:hypothetical protein